MSILMTSLKTAAIPAVILTYIGIAGTTGF